jgi:predicted transposase
MYKEERDNKNICAIIGDMKLTVKVKLQPTTEQFEQLLATLTEANQCCNAISETAYREKTFKQFALHKLVYQASRQQYRLSSQMVIRAIGRVADSYKAGSKKQRGFRQRGAFPYDARILSFQLEQQKVSI